MKKSLSVLLMATSLWATSCQSHDNSLPPNPADGAVNERHPMKDSLEAIVSRYVAKGIPGVQVAVLNGDGWYFTGAGYASVEQKTPITPAMTNWYFSISKIYTASLVMKLVENGKIDLDAPMGKYLSADAINGIPKSDQITVRMLLNHSSGIVDLIRLPAFLERQFSDPLHQPSVDERLQMVSGQPLNFEPGSDFSYSNTNYLLLTLIVEKASGQSYGQFLKEQIINPLALKETYYELSDANLKSLPFSDYYADLDASGNLQNATAWNKALGNSSVGYGGIAGTARDAIRFMRAFVQGKVVSARSMQEMKTWIQGRESTQPDYGLGLEYFQFGPGTPQFGHEGDGVGNTTQLMYVPDNDTYLFINCLVGRQLPGPYFYKSTDMKIDLSKYVAGWRKRS